MESEFLTSGQAAQFLQVSINTLSCWRSRGTGPSYVKLGKRLIRYRKSDLDAWIKSESIGVTSPDPETAVTE